MRNRDLRPAAKANPTIQQTFERFQKYNRLKNLSQGSLDFYVAKGRSFFRYLGDTEQPITTITEETVEDYIFYMSATARPFFDYWELRNMIPEGQHYRLPMDYRFVSSVKFFYRDDDELDIIRRVQPGEKILVFVNTIAKLRKLRDALKADGIEDVACLCSKYRQEAEEFDKLDDVLVGNVLQHQVTLTTTTLYNGVDACKAGLSAVKEFFDLNNIRKVLNDADGRYYRFLDYFWSESELGATTQCIEFGNNLLDLDYYVKAYDIVNRVTYYGYQTTGWWIFAHTDKISVTVEDEESVRIYGPIERCYVADGTASTQESLTKAAKEKLNELKLKMDYSFEISALDLRDAGVDTMRLGFMKRAQIMSWPHELSQWALCTKLSIPLDKLNEKKFTFGSASETLSGKQATGTGAAKRAVDTLRSVVSYINR